MTELGLLTTKEAAVKELKRRDAFTKTTSEKQAAAPIRTLTEQLENSGEEVLTSDVLVKVANVIDVFDRCMGVSQHYGSEFDYPEDVLFSFTKTINSLLGSGKLSAKEAKFCLDQLLEVDDILGILDHEAMPVPFVSLPEEVKDLLEQRELARANKDFATADGLREKLLELGFNVEDSSEGARVFRVR